MRTFDGLTNKHHVYRGEVCVKKFCESLRENAMKMISFEKTKMISLINKKYESYLNQTTALSSKKVKTKIL